MPIKAINLLWNLLILAGLILLHLVTPNVTKDASVWIRLLQFVDSCAWNLYFTLVLLTNGGNFLALWRLFRLFMHSRTPKP